MRFKSLYLLGFSLLLCACAPNTDINKEVPENPADFNLRTNQTTYLAEPDTGFSYSFSLTAELENTTGETLYLDLCYPDDTYPIYGVTLADEESGESAWNPAWGCVGHSESIALEPGETRTDTYQLTGPTSSKDGQPLGEMEGLFRLFYRTLACADSDECEASGIISNAFRIELAE